MCAEASTILRVVAAEFLFKCPCLEVPSDNCIGLNIALYIRSLLLVESFGLRPSNQYILVGGDS
jgi:hypothetical protein